MAVWDDQRVQPHVRAAAKEIADTFGITNIGGFATAGHIPDSDHYKGLAIDVMTVTQGQQVASWVVQNASRLSVTYLIWNRKIYDTRDSKGWVDYHGSSPHTDHVHISFYPTPHADAAGTATAASSPPQGCLGWLSNLFPGL